jgi:hypothetical protein
VAERPAGRVPARELVARLNRQAAALREHEIVAPLLPGGRIRTRLDGIVYEFSPTTDFAGWGRFRPRDERSAEPLGEALPWQRGAYLELFPLLRVVLLWPDPDPRRGAWLAIPFNESDAHQRFGLGADPLPVYLCDPLAGADRFERMIARVDGRTLWFDGPDPLAPPVHAEWLRDAATADEPPEHPLSGLAGSERRALLLTQIHRIEEEWGQGRVPAEVARLSHREQQEWLRRGRARLRLEEQLRHALSKAGAVLHGCTEVRAPDGTPQALVVEWSERGERHRYRSTIDHDLTVISSGICLSNRDRDFDLTSLVSVMGDG